MIDPNRPVTVICTGRPNPAAMRALEDYLIDRAIERAAQDAQSGVTSLASGNDGEPLKRKRIQRYAKRKPASQPVHAVEA